MATKSDRMSSMVLPQYVELPGHIVARAPFLATDVLLHAYTVRGERGALQRLCDRMLNAPANGAVRFQVVTSYVVVIGLYIPRIQSTDPVDAQRGYVRETDVAFWILTLGGPTLDPLQWKLRWTPAYMFVDCPPAMAVGREMFGYPKNLGLIERTSQINDQGGLTVNGLAYTKQGPNEVAEIRKIFSIDPVQVSANISKLPMKKALESWRSVIANDDQLLRADGLDLGALSLPQMNMPMVFLKQFRDISTPNAACFQSITSCDTQTVTVKDSGTFSDSYSLQISPLESHPILADLGIAHNGALLAPSFWLIQDFTAGFGETLWQQR